MFKIIKITILLSAVTVLVQCADRPKYALNYNTDLAELFQLVPCAGGAPVDLSYILSPAIQGSIEVYGLSADHLNSLYSMLQVFRAQNVKRPGDLIFSVSEDDLLEFNIEQAQALLRHISFKKLPSRDAYVLVHHNAFDSAVHHLPSEKQEEVAKRLGLVKQGDLTGCHGITKAKDIHNVFSEMQFNQSKLRVYYICIDNRFIGLLFAGDKNMPAQRDDIKAADDNFAATQADIAQIKNRRAMQLAALRCIEE
jgi:hypothetical protein